MKIKLTLCLIGITCFFSSFCIHPMNMSVGNISYKDKKIQVKFNFFTNTMEGPVSRYCKTDLDMGLTGYDQSTEKSLQKYIAAHFDMAVNGSPCKLIYKKGTLNRNVLMVEYEAPFKAKIKSLKIKNTLLFNVDVPEMKNIMNVNLNNTIKVLEFDNDEKIHVQDLKF